MPNCAFRHAGAHGCISPTGEQCRQPGTCRVVYELDEEPGMETEDYRAFCPRHAERYAEILRASGVVRSARVVEA